MVPLLVALPAVPLFATGALQQAVAQGLHRPVAGLAAWSLARQLTVLAGAGVAARWRSWARWRWSTRSSGS